MTRSPASAPIDVAVHAELSTLSLCSGIGGLDIGVKMAFGGRIVCCVEREAYAAGVLVARMEDQTLGQAPIWDDLSTFDGHPWRGKVDCIVAGVPCQPFSSSGQRKELRGEKDERYLWPEVDRLLREIRPTIFVLENVRGLIHNGLWRILEDLSELGFLAEWGVYRADTVGSPQVRARLFLLAYSGLRGREVLRSLAVQQSEWAAFRNNTNRGYPHLEGDRPCFPPGPNDDWREIPEGLHPSYECGVLRMADGIPYRLDRLRSLGNAVVPQQAALALTDLLTRIQRHHDGI